MSHTKGPWVILDVSPFPCPTDGAGEPNPPAALVGPVGSDEGLAFVFAGPNEEDDPFSMSDNANLVAAAPDLLEALKNLYTAILKPQGFQQNVASALMGAHKAIQKAEGEER